MKENSKNVQVKMQRKTSYAKKNNTQKNTKNSKSCEFEKHIENERQSGSNFSVTNEKCCQTSFCDTILANFIMLFAVAISAFVPVVSIALPFLVFIYLEVGVFGFILHQKTTKTAKFEDLFVSLKLYIKIFCTAIVKIVLILFWTVIFIVPGIICMLDLAFSSLIIFESKDLDVKGVLMLSKEIAKGHRWQIFFFFMLALASVCVAMSMMFLIILLFDLFLVVVPQVYIVLVVFAGLFDFVVLALPMCQLAITQAYIEGKKNLVESKI